MTVVLDTNALMMPVECDLRLFDELDRLIGDPECVVPEPVVSELQSLAGRSDEEATAASVGLDLTDRCGVRQTTAEYADDAVVELATLADVTHAVTNDGPLQSRLLDTGIPVISLRGNNKLSITQP